MAQRKDGDPRTLYFIPNRGWFEQDDPPEGAAMMISNNWKSSTDIVVNNKLQKRDREGGWQILTPQEETTLSGEQRGYYFQVRPRLGEAGQFWEVSSARYVDEQMFEQLFGKDIGLFDLELKRIKPKEAQGKFCIQAAQFPTFQQRVQAQGGVIAEGQTDLQELYGKLMRMNEISQHLEMLCADSRAVIDQIANGTQTEAPSILQRCEQANLLRSEAARLSTAVQEGKIALDRRGDMLEAQAHAGAYAENAKQQMEHIQQLHSEHASYESQMRMRIQESISRTLPGSESPATTRRYLLLPVVEYYTDLGYDCRMIEGGMIIRIGDTVVELSDKPQVRTNEGTASAEQILGRHTADRSQREL